jgi:methionyl-tRNA formyltransferase
LSPAPVRVAFAGTNWWSAQALERLAGAPGLEIAHVISQPDRPAGRGRKTAAPPVAVTARELGLELSQPERPGEALPRLQREGVQAVAVVAYGELVPRSLLDALPFVNLHPSALPHWRGAAPIERALMAGEREGAVAAMLLVEALDAGPVAALERFAVGEDDDAGVVYARALELGLEPLARALQDASRGRLATVPQVGEASYAAKITAADRLLDPGRPARELHDRVRALSPHIGGRLPLDGAPHTIWRTRVVPAGPATGILERDGESVLLGCGEGALEILELQAPGGRRMPAADWLRGLRGALPAATDA